jgi:hypothetical protein
MVGMMKAAVIYEAGGPEVLFASRSAGPSHSTRSLKHIDVWKKIRPVGRSSS